MKLNALVFSAILAATSARAIPFASDAPAEAQEDPASCDMPGDGCELLARAAEAVAGAVADPMRMGFHHSSYKRSAEAEPRRFMGGFHHSGYKRDAEAEAEADPRRMGFHHSGYKRDADAEADPRRMVGFHHSGYKRDAEAEAGPRRMGFHHSGYKAKRGLTETQKARYRLFVWLLQHYKSQPRVVNHPEPNSSRGYGFLPGHGHAAYKVKRAIDGLGGAAAEAYDRATPGEVPTGEEYAGACHEEGGHCDAVKQAALEVHELLDGVDHQYAKDLIAAADEAVASLPEEPTAEEEPTTDDSAAE